MPDLISEAYDAIKTCVGDKGYRTDKEALQFSEDWYGDTIGIADLVVLPNSTEMVSDVMRICSKAGINVTAQGGRTGLVGASTPGKVKPSIVLNLSRMNKLRDIDTAGNTMAVDAGMTLEDVRTCADGKDRLFPLNIGSRGSCQIGGNIATNAGGLNVVGYGNTRDLVLGLEAVLPDGTIWSDMIGLRKDNTGYDLKQLLIGSEGTLAVITGAILKLFPLPSASATAMMGVPDTDAAIALLAMVKQSFGPSLTAFELISDASLVAAERIIGSATVGLSMDAPWSVIIEVSGGGDVADYLRDMENIFASALETGLVADGVLAQNQAQQDAIWSTREAIVEGLHYACRHDISVRIADIPRALKALDATVHAIDKDAIIAAYGHMGDGNLHYGVVPGGDHTAVGPPDVTKKIKAGVYEVIHQMNGSFSAEHGVGRNLADFERYKDPISRLLMTRIKAAFDPQNRMNPGVLISHHVD